MVVYDTARQLAEELKSSDEYRTYTAARETALANETTRTLVAEYHKLQLQAQAVMVQGGKDEELLQKLQKVGEVLQLDKDASAFLLAEYRLNRMLGDVYKILAEAIDVDLSGLEG